MMEKRSFRTAVLLSAVMMMLAVEASAQTISVKVGAGEKEEKKEEPKEKVVEKVVEKSGASIEQEIRKIFGVKTETSLTGARVENIGKYFLDKHTGEVTMVSNYRNEPIRWRILRDRVEEDFIFEDQVVNYQMIRYGNSENDIVLVNINSGAMWTLDFKGMGFNNKNSRFKYIPMRDTEW